MNVAYVTGVSRGLGAAMAADLLAAGWQVVGIGRSSAPVLAGACYAFVDADLADLVAAAPRAAAVMRANARRWPDGRAVLINNAARIEPVGVLGSLEVAALLQSLTVNLAAPTVMANAFCAAYATAAHARLVINVTSGLAGRAITGQSLYSIAKCGMEMLTRALTVDHADATFRAVTLRPGIIDTDMQRYIRNLSADVLPDVAMFANFHASGQLVAPATVAAKARAVLIEADVEAGRTYNYAEL